MLILILNLYMSWGCRGPDERKFMILARTPACAAWATYHTPENIELRRLGAYAASLRAELEDMDNSSHPAQESPRECHMALVMYDCHPMTLTDR